jgi:hypothetical protein
MLPGLPGLPGARDGGVSGLRGVRGLPGSPEFPGGPEAVGGAELFRSTARRDLRALCDGVRGLELPGALEPGAIAPGPAVCAPVAAESRMPSGSATQGVIRIDMEIALARKCGVAPDSHLTSRRMHALQAAFNRSMDSEYVGSGESMLSAAPSPRCSKMSIGVRLIHSRSRCGSRFGLAAFSLHASTDRVPARARFWRLSLDF